MDSRQSLRVPAGRQAGGALLGVAFGVIMPLVAVLQISLLVPVLMLGGILAVHIKARCGWIAAGVALAAQLASAAYFLGGSVALMVLAACVAPALLVITQVDRKRPFFEQMKLGVPAYGAGLVAAMLIAYASFGGGMVARFVDILRAEYGRMPDSALQPLVDSVNSMLAVNGAVNLNSLMTVDSFRSQLFGVLDLMQEVYAETLPGTLLSGALLSGALSVLWGNWTMARRGLATNESFVGMGGWFLPAQLSLGAVGLWLVGLILNYSGYSGGATVYSAVSQLAGAAFCVQALSALDRRMMRSGRSLSRRRLLIALLAVAALLMRGFSSVMSYVGAASALFGSHGAIRRWIEARQNDSSDHDDPNE